MNPAKLGIIAGSGELPRRVIETCQQSQRPYFVVALEDNTPSEMLESAPHAWIKLGEIGRAIDLLRQESVDELVLAGPVKRPRLSNIRPDTKAAKLLARLGSSLLMGDDKLLKHIIGFLEEEGFRVVGVEEVVNDILTPAGLVGTAYPDRRMQTDIEIGARVAKRLGELDVGQAVIVYHSRVLGVEAAEGTDALIARCALLKPEERGGVLVKAQKPGQERRADLPTIGVETVENVHAAGFAGIAIEAGKSIMLNRRAIAARASELGIVVIGFSDMAGDPLPETLTEGNQAP